MHRLFRKPALAIPKFSHSDVKSGLSKESPFACKSECSLSLQRKETDVPKLQTFQLDYEIVSRCIYRDYPHQTTGIGLVIERSFTAELSRFLKRFIDFLGCSEHLFLRLDVFLEGDLLKIIEINVELQEGWGVALNLLRASGNKLRLIDSTVLPGEIIAYYEDYVPEFELAQREFAILGHGMRVVGWRERPGVTSSKLNDKLLLAQFSRVWQGKLVRVPLMYAVENTLWENLPEDVVFKFCDKHGRPSRRAGYSVARRGPKTGKGTFIRQCYEKSTVVAQEYVEPLRLDDGSATQAIILCSGATPVTGYLQVAPRGVFVINDKTAIKGVLVLE